MATSKEDSDKIESEEVEDSLDISIDLDCSQSSEYDKGDDEIRSVAIVKKSQFEFPVSFRELQSNTDLKTPPSNWLRGQFSVCFPNLTSKRSDFTSFIMGYQFPDCVGEVDIVSDAENIKKLLKIAYKPNTHLSMMVHRIGKTLLIDEFDIYKCLLRQSEQQWKWLRKFFYKHVLESLEMKEHSVIVRPDKSRDVVQSRNLLSKFLYHSIEEDTILPSAPAQSTKDDHQPVSIFSPTKDPSFELPVEEYFPDSPPQSFTRNVIWKFEDLCMLIGTDLPIFGGRTHPCVSLRLKDMDKPINILTGIDYWLDNLMCNVPEVVMCYHQDGIVQKYELVKTEDLPQMPDCQFSPQLVTDIAHNILSFLKSKATKEGHTYWLFKGKDDDIVKLYDLTSLCNEDEIFESFVKPNSDEENPSDLKDEPNPFTIPVAMLFYYVAKNIWYSKEDSEDKEISTKQATVKNLLENALHLLSKERKEKYSKIYSHAHLILADVFLPQDFDPDSPHLSDIKKDDLEVTKKLPAKEAVASDRQNNNKKKTSKNKSNSSASHANTVSTACNSIKLASLCRRRGNKRNKHKTADSLPKLSSNVYERCNEAINHVIDGLVSLSTLSSSSETKKGEGEEGRSETGNTADKPEEKQTFAKPFVPIPMPYESLSKDKVPERDKGSRDASTTTNNKMDTKATTSEVTDTSVHRHQSNTPKGVIPKTSIKNVGKKNKQNSIVTKTLLTKHVINSQLKDATWVEKIMFQLLRKASLVYMTKGRIELDASQYGLCLRYAKLSLRAWCCMLSILGTEVEFPLPSQPLLIAGDAYYSLSRFWDIAPTHIESFNSLTEELRQMNQIMDGIPSVEDCSWMIKIPCDNVESMMLSYSSFDAAVQNTNNPDKQLQRRLASICNELGCMYMSQADQICQKLNTGIKSGSDLWEDSWKFLDKASAIFRSVNDNNNVALLHCNRGRYLRLYAFHCSSIGGKQIFTNVLKKNYEKAFDEYEMALGIINPKGPYANIAESVVWEYSTALFGYGTIVQDAICLGDQEDEDLIKYLSNLYNKCLKFCDTKSASKELLYEYRAGVIHIRLAAIYHNKYRRKGEGKMLYLAEMHYQKSAQHFHYLDSSPSDILKVHLDHVVLLEDSLQGVKIYMGKWKTLIAIVELLLKCENGLMLIQEQTEEEHRNKKKEDLKGTKDNSRDKTTKNKEKKDSKEENETNKKEMKGKERKNTKENEVAGGKNTTGDKTTQDKEKKDSKEENETKKKEMKGKERKNTKENEVTGGKNTTGDKTTQNKEENKEPDNKSGKDVTDDDVSSDESQFLTSLLELFEKKLKSILLELIKLSKSSNSKITKTYEQDIRKMYMTCLNKDNKCLSVHLLETVSTIKPLFNQISHISVR